MTTRKELTPYLLLADKELIERNIRFLKKELCFLNGRLDFYNKVTEEFVDKYGDKIKAVYGYTDKIEVEFKILETNKSLEKELIKARQLKNILNSLLQFGIIIKRKSLKKKR